MRLTLKTDPAAEPLSLAEAKAHLRIEGADDDTLITSLIKAARTWCEHHQNRAYITQTWELTFDDWPEIIDVPLPPLQTVVSIEFYDTAGVVTVLAPADYQVDIRGYRGRIAPAYGKTWPTTTLRPLSGIVVTFTAGYGVTADVPETAKQAMKLLVGHWYENREAVFTGSTSKEIEFAVGSLLGQTAVAIV